jgi:hypothetical protein
MEAVGWVRRLVPIGVLAMAVASAVGGPEVMGAADTPWDPPPCPGSAPATGPAPRATRAWFRTMPTVDRTGTLDAQRLAVGLSGRGVAQVELPPESFATGPVDGQLLVGDDDGLRSRLRLVDLTRDCVRASMTATAVIRSAVLAADLGVIWEHRVDRASRDDLGVWQWPAGDGLIGADAAIQVLPGLTPDEAHGPTFVTDLRWTAGGRLVVASCGQLVCRTRILDPATSRIAAIDGTGPAIGASHDVLVAYDVCVDTACPILAVDLATGERTPLVDAAGPAELGGPDDSILVLASNGRGLEMVEVTTKARTTPGADPRLAPVRRGSIASAGADLPTGQLLLAPTGQLADASDAATIDPASGTVEPLEEVLP